MEWELFAGLTAEEAREALSRARRRTFLRGDVVFHDGDPGDTLHLIARGRFAIRVTTPAGQTTILRLFGPGDLIGRIGLPSIGAVRAATLVALDPGETYEFYRAQIDELRAAHPSINDALLISLARHLQSVSERLTDMLFMDADSRVRRRLLQLHRLYQDEDPERGAGITLTQEDIAGLAGTSRATVNRVLAQEESRGTLRRRRGRIVVVDPEDIATRAE